MQTDITAMISASVLAAFVGGGAGVAVDRYYAQPAAVPAQQIAQQAASAAAMLDQFTRANVLLERELQAQYQAQGDALAIAAAREVNDGRMILIGRIIAKSITGTDPLPVLQRVKATDPELPATAADQAKARFKADADAMINAAKQAK